MDENTKKNIHNQRIYFFDKNYSALSFIKLCIFLNSRLTRDKMIRYTIGEVSSDNNESKYVMFNIHDDDIFKTSSKIISKECIRILEDENIRLTHKDYYIEFGPNLYIMHIGRICDEARIKLRFNQFNPSKHQIKNNDCTLSSILAVIQYDKFKDGGFNNFIKDCVEFVGHVSHDKSMTVKMLPFKSFMSPSFKGSFDYSCDVNYNKLFLALAIHCCKHILDKHANVILKVGPLQLRMYSGHIIIKLFHTWVEGKKEKGVKLNKPKYNITDINQLSDKATNLICYIINNYPSSFSIKNTISELALNNNE